MERRKEAESLVFSFWDLSELFFFFKKKNQGPLSPPTCPLHTLPHPSLTLETFSKLFKRFQTNPFCKSKFFEFFDIRLEILVFHQKLKAKS